VLSRYARLLSTQRRMLDAGMAMRRSIEIDQPIWLEKPTDFNAGHLLVAKNLGLILCAAGQVD
jgi:hypothetical protein